MWSSLTPQLPVADVGAAQAWYRDVLGFEIAWSSPDFGAVWLDHVEIFFARASTAAPTAPQAAPAACLCVRVDDADALAALVRERGASIVDELEDKPWGMREFTIEDPSGHRLRIGHAIPGRSRWVVRPRPAE